MAPTLLDIAVFAWVVLSLTPRSLKHPFFALAFPTFDDLEGILIDSPVTFAPGLWEVLRSTSPPVVSFFKSLPTYSPRFRRKWAIYLHVLEKAGCQVKIYIGIGTDKRRGVSARLSQYRNGQCIPHHVQRALNRGYKITHTGLLCWAPIPASAIVVFRGLFLLLEAAFTLHLWAMVSSDKDYGMPHLCPWSSDSRTYGGLCSHFSLVEGVRGAVEVLTAEDIASINAEITLKHSRQDKATRGPERLADDQRRYAKKSRRVEKFKCHTCNVVFPTGAAKKRHLKTQKHADNLAGKIKVVKSPTAAAILKANQESRRYYRSVCKKASQSQQNLDRHLKSALHLRKVAASSS